MLVVSLTGKTLFSPCLRSRLKIGFAKGVRLSRPASACSFSTPRLNLVLTHEIPPAFRNGVHIYRHPPSGQPIVDRVTQLRIDGVHCRESAGTGPPVVLKVAKNMLICREAPVTYREGVALEDVWHEAIGTVD